jgi:hypothetical protein
LAVVGNSAAASRRRATESAANFLKREGAPRKIEWRGGLGFCSNGWQDCLAKGSARAQTQLKASQESVSPFSHAVDLSLHIAEETREPRRRQRVVKKFCLFGENPNETNAS